jgi:hypothetical protein
LNGNGDLLFYRFGASERISPVASSVPVSVTEFRPTLFRLKQHAGSSLIFLFWYVFTRGRYRIFYGMDAGGETVHYSVVLPKFFKFPFMRGDDLEIGPCWTHESYRGRNIYPAVITRILKRFKKEERAFFMLTHRKNVASQKGIEKAGFRSWGRGRKSGWLGIYNVETCSEQA